MPRKFRFCVGFRKYCSIYSLCLAWARQYLCSFWSSMELRAMVRLESTLLYAWLGANHFALLRPLLHFQDKFKLWQNRASANTQPATEASCMLKTPPSAQPCDTVLECGCLSRQHSLGFGPVWIQGFPQHFPSLPHGSCTATSCAQMRGLEGSCQQVRQES